MNRNPISLLKNVIRLIPYSFKILFYFLRYYNRKIRFPFAEKKTGFSILLVTYNRSTFLKLAIESILTNTKSTYELIIFDNASSDDTKHIVNEAINRNPGKPIQYHFSKFNYGTNAYALAFLHSQYSYVVVMDDDILALQTDWDEKAEQCFRDFPEIGFLALDVIQDQYTNGAKHAQEKYKIVKKEPSTIQAEGPAGGWFGITLRKIYFQSGGFIFRPDKPFRLHDADYVRKVGRNGYISAILYHVYAYHASGESWAAAGNYQEIWKEKYKLDYKELAALTDYVDQSNIPEFSVPKRAIELQ